MKSIDQTADYMDLEYYLDSDLLSTISDRDHASVCYLAEHS